MRITSICPQWRREGLKAGGDRSKCEKSRKCLLRQMTITFFGKFSIFCPKFSGEVPTEDLFFCSPCWFFRFPGEFPGNFCPKIGENDLLHFRKKTSKREKAYPKMGEGIPQNGRKFSQNFQKQGEVYPPRSRRHCLSLSE